MSATVPYADTSYAFSYFSERLHTSAYDDASTEDKVKALKQATRAIDNLNFAGDKHDESFDATTGIFTQPNQFPRGDDTLVPDAVKDACCELALTLLDDVDPDLEIENLQNTSGGISDARITRDTSYVQEHVRAGIPSIRAWLLLVPFLRDTQHPRIRLERGD